MAKIKLLREFIFIILFSVMQILALKSNMFNDRYLFSIKLAPPTKGNTLFTPLKRGGDIRAALSGPIIMDNNALLFYNLYGYVLYHEDGSVLDSHTVFTANLNISEQDPSYLKVAFPSDKRHILYYHYVGDSPDQKHLTVYEKEIFKSKIKPLKKTKIDLFKNIDKSHMVNMLHNSVTDDMVTQSLVSPYLIGFNFEGKHMKRLWCLNTYTPLLEPCFLEHGKKSIMFFSGINGVENKRKRYINPLSIFKMGKHHYVAGIEVKIDNEKEKNYQKIYYFDRAGNFLHLDSILKVENKNAVIGEDRMSYFTINQMSTFVFQPQIADNGLMFYGAMNFDNNEIYVHKKVLSTLKAFPTEESYSTALIREQSILFDPMSKINTNKQVFEQQLPKIYIKGSNNQKRYLTEQQLRFKNKQIFIARRFDKELVKNLKRSIPRIPKKLQEIKDTYAKYNINTPIDYIVYKNAAKQRKVLQYPVGTRVESVRILGQHKSGNIIVRVDCDLYAELVAFSPQGEYVFRFRFNNQDVRTRKDHIAIESAGNIIELDFESKKNKPSFYSWKLIDPSFDKQYIKEIKPKVAR